jgi:phenylacetate-coenzyme A ligase PaaK-like adenylate-forming protein
VLDAAIAQLRFAASLALGRPFRLGSLDRLVDALRATLDEFGALDPEGAELVTGPTLDETTRLEVQHRRFRAQATRAARETAYYARLFADLGLDPARLRPEDVARVPLTAKAALRDDPDAFVRRSARPYLRGLTTGTTGCPTSVYFSLYELRVAVALAAIAFLTSGQITPDDVVRVSASSRGTLGNIGVAGACARIGALVYLAGVVDPAQALALLAEKHHLPGKKPRANILVTYLSYLGLLVEAGLAAGYRPADFGLERVFIGGEVVSRGLAARAEALFGPLAFGENWTMTETIPFGGTLCEAGHLHFEPSHGLLEVQVLERDGSAAPGEVGSLVVTPFPPYRETTLLLRYDTEHLVEALAAPPTCRLRHLPATGHVLGKRALAVRHDGGWTLPRDLLEPLASLACVPLPARYGAWAEPGGVAVEVLVREDTAAVRRAVEAALGERGVPLRALRLVTTPDALREPRPLRCDLREASFGPLPATGQLVPF